MPLDALGQLGERLLVEVFPRLERVPLDQFDVDVSRLDSGDGGFVVRTFRARSVVVPAAEQGAEPANFSDAAKSGVTVEVPEDGLTDYKLELK